VHLQVSDLYQSLSYYERVLGLSPRTVTGESATLSADADESPLVMLHTRPGVTRAQRGAFGLYHVAILLPDRAVLGRFAAHVTSLDVTVAMADHLVSEALYLWDPDGLGIEVYADRPRTTWKQHDRELAMTTDPLDIDSVIAASNGAKWTGAPSRTTIGHVHLHVGRLDLAELFYHHGLGFDKTVWSYPGALFLSAGGYHHHLAMNVWSPGPAPSSDQAQLLEWELLVPSEQDVAAVERSLKASGYRTSRTGDALASADPWGTRVRVRSQPRT
jgi:catechol 2,3-dioxygenase